jgi:NADH-quinone oxidoreductase subunit C
MRFIRQSLKLDLIWLNDGEFVVYVPYQCLHVSLNFLSKSTLCRFSLLSDLFCVDYPRRLNRFELNYVLLSPLYKSRIRLKVLVSAKVGVKSASSIFRNANWFEREVWDMYGVFFFDHPDLRRILTDYGFRGHPLRKDYPLSGFVELRYHEGLKRIVMEPLEFSQKYRYFEFSNPWN